MSKAREFDMREKKFLVIDDNSFHRGIISETLRAYGAARVDCVGSVEAAMELFRRTTPDLIISEWELPVVDGLEFTRRIRMGETPLPVDISVIMVTSKRTEQDVVIARKAGVDEFLTKPFSTSALMDRVAVAFGDKREFVKSSVYVGPCRRRNSKGGYGGPLRRLFDEEMDMTRPEDELRKTLMEKQINRAMEVARNVTAGDRKKIREVYNAAKEIAQISEDMGDKLVATAADCLKSYIEGVGASSRFDPEVVDAHIDSMMQLVQLPNAESEMREKVARALSIMVKKKLKAADEAA